MNFHESPYRSMADAHLYLCECPRCGHLSFEHLSSYAHCLNCFHFCDYQQEFLPLDFLMKEFENDFHLRPRPKKYIEA